MTDVASEDVSVDKRGHLRPPVVSRHYLEGAVFTEVSGKSQVVAGVDDLCAKLVVVGHVELTTVVKKTVYFLPLGNAVGQASWRFAPEKCESRSDLRLMLSATSDCLKEFRGVAECNCRGDAEVFWLEDDAFAVVVGVGELTHRGEDTVDPIDLASEAARRALQDASAAVGHRIDTVATPGILMP